MAPPVTLPEQLERKGPLDVFLLLYRSRRKCFSLLWFWDEEWVTPASEAGARVSILDPHGNQEPIRPVSPNPRGDRRMVQSFPSGGWGLQRILASEDSLPSSQHPRLGTTKHPRGRDRKGEKPGLGCSLQRQCLNSVGHSP